MLVSGYLPGPTVAEALERAQGTWLVLAPALLDPLPPGANAILVDDVEARRITGSAAEEAARLLGESFRLAVRDLRRRRGRSGARRSPRDGQTEARRRREPGRRPATLSLQACSLRWSVGVGLRDALEAGCGLGATVAAGVPS